MTAENPEDYSPPVREEEVRAALDAVDAAASTHGANYGSGMRQARAIVEQRLLGSREDDDGGGSSD